MSCSYLYEIRRKSEDFETMERKSSIFSDCSKDEEIWEVPEESIGSTYQPMSHNEEQQENEEVEQEITSMPEPLNLKQYENTRTFHLSLSMEKIALKSSNKQSEGSNKKSRNTTQTINKSFNTETDGKKSMTGGNTTNTTANATTNAVGSKVQWKNSKIFNSNNNNNHSNCSSSTTPLFNFTIVPINVASQEQKHKQEEHGTVLKLPQIKLTSFSTNRAPLNPISGKTTILKPNTGHCSPDLNGSRTYANVPRPKSSSISEINKHATENSTSPESLLDNILSAASSLSVQSSSQSSNGVYADLDVATSKQDVKCWDNSKAQPCNTIAQNKSDTFSKPIPELKVITVPHSPSNKQTFNIRPYPPMPSLLTISNVSNSDSFETASNKTRTPSASPLHNLSPRVPSEASLYPDDLRCKICNELFKDPRCLNCLHSFCFQCIVDENFKQDDSIPFWSQPQSNQLPPDVSTSHKQLEDLDFKVLNSSNTSARSIPQDIQTVRSYSDLSNSPSQQKLRSSFTFKRKKSSDRLLSKHKTDNTAASLSSQPYQATPQLKTEMSRLIMCKVCQFQTEVPVGGIRQLPQNFLLVRKIEEIRFKVGEEILTRIWCTLCYEETNATYHCITCLLNLCTLCKESHERQKSTTKHNIKNIVELRRSRKDQGANFIDNSKFVLKCSMHPGFDIKSFCTSCLQVACSDCLILLHKGHKHETISKSIQGFVRILRATVEQTKPFCSYAEHSIEKLNDIAKNINRKCDEIQAEVTDFMVSYFEALEAHKNTLLQQVHRARQSKIEMILEQQLDLEKLTQDTMQAIKFSQELTDIASDVEILSFLKMLLKRFEYCQNLKAPIDPKISDTLHFLPKIRAPAAKNQNDITLFGIITMQTVDPLLCTLQWDGISQLRLHRKAELVLISRDADGAPLCHGGLQIKCQIKYKDNPTKLLPLDICDNRDGSYIISFTPDAQGTIILTITINNKPIKGSPFNLQARSLHPHNGIYHCCAFCSSKGNKSVKCACDGRMPGFNGCGHGHAGHPGRRHWSCCGNVLENSECTVANKLLNS